MIKWIFKKIKAFYENEYEGSFTIEFSIYDVFFLCLIILWLLYLKFEINFTGKITKFNKSNESGVYKIFLFKFVI